MTTKFRKREIANTCSGGPLGELEGTLCSSRGLIARNALQMWLSEEECLFAEKDYRIALVSKQ